MEREVEFGQEERDASNAEFNVESTECLNSIDFIAKFKSKGFDRLRIGELSHVLDVQCGHGEDTIALASRIGKSGKVVGIDPSSALIETACKKARRKKAFVDFFQMTDLHHTGFPNDTFDACRIDTMLQNTRGSKEIFVEMTRVLKPGGVLLATDNVWESFSINASKRTTTKKIVKAWWGNFRRDWAGRMLHKNFISCGIENVNISPETLIVTDFQLADQIFSVTKAVIRAAAKDMISLNEGRAWLDEVHRLSEHKLFYCTYTAVMVWGQKK